MKSKPKIVIRKRKPSGKIAFTNEQYKQLVEFSPEPIVVYSNGIVVYINPSGVKMIGAASPKEVLGKSISEFLPPDSVQITMEQIGQLFEYGKHSDMIEKKWVRLDGRVITVEVRAAPIKYKGDPAVQLLCRDITERKQAEFSLMESELRYRQLLQLSPEAIFVHSDGIIIYTNDAGMRMLRAESNEQVIGKSIFDFIHHRFHEAASNRLVDVDKAINVLEFINHQFIRCDGETFEGEGSSGVTYRYLDKTVIQTTIRDTTERSRREQSLRESEKLSVIGQMAAGVAHEIRNPLTALMGFNQLLMEKFQGNKAYCEIMETELQRINYIVNEFMQLARPLPSNYKQHNLNTLFNTLLSVVQSYAVMSNVDLNIEYENVIPVLICDDNQLKQVFLNVMKNAIEAMPNGGNLRIQVKKETSQVLIRFVDNGHGIKEDELVKVGSPFYTTKEQGTGLGLMICKKIIQEHSGEMKIDSSFGNGTVVTILFPIIN